MQLRRKHLEMLINDIGQIVHTAIPTCSSHHGLTAPSVSSRPGSACAAGLTAEWGQCGSKRQINCCAQSQHYIVLLGQHKKAPFRPMF